MQLYAGSENILSKCLWMTIRSIVVYTQAVYTNVQLNLGIFSLDKQWMN